MKEKKAAPMKNPFASEAISRRRQQSPFTDTTISSNKRMLSPFVTQKVPNSSEIANPFFQQNNAEELLKGIITSTNFRNLWEKLLARFCLVPGA